MATEKSAPTPTPQTARRTQPTRRAITFELVQAHAPHAALAENLSRTFGLDPVDYAAVREGVEEGVASIAKSLADALNDKAMQIALQRLVGSLVSGAFGGAQFYGTKVTQAKDLTMASQNDDRDEGRDGAFGSESKADRARRFAAEMGLQAFALMGAAEGAVSAYAHLTGEDWKPYEPPAAPSAGTARQSAATELAVFGG